jgi:hypothetical protein
VSAVTTAEEAAPVLAAVRSRTSPWWIGWLVPPATILVVLVGAVLLLMTPLWMHPALDASGALNVTEMRGYRQALITVSDRTVSELLFGPGTFVITVPDDCVPPSARACPIPLPFYAADEAAHLRDARLVLYLFLVPAAISLVFLMATVMRRGRDARVWRAIARGGKALVIATIVLGIIGVLAFGAAFTLFHQIFFPGGNWEFPPDSNLIRLYPYAFWQLTSVALGVLCIAGGTVAWLVGRRRAAKLAARP